MTRGANPRYKLTMDLARQIRREWRELVDTLAPDARDSLPVLRAEMAARYGVHPWTLLQVLSHKTWREPGQ